MRTCLIVAIVGIVARAFRPWPRPSRESAAMDRFEKKVRPLLAARCWQCHGPEKSKGGLRLDIGGSDRGRRRLGAGRLAGQARARAG